MIRAVRTLGVGVERGRRMQNRPTTLNHRLVIRSRLDQSRDDPGIVGVPGGGVQGSLAVAIPGIGIGSCLGQGRNDGGIGVVLGRNVQRSAEFLVLGSGGGAGCDQGGEDVGIGIVSGHCMQGRPLVFILSLRVDA